ncbi:hypothetical protein ES319_A13G176700v1 [Gossypium barbadense]|uniref:Uncharacterized protein n=2 Tax=Gossypium TaxID=3633 RepID=A0A5J5T6Q1_GOSBA|nr:hypothetical protein ES319_A13G176700v1 [Gossypium barbadense]TYG87132.1 hypothetical protein ES288_A13G188900v1 [Gossypium darwinii]
MLQQQTNNNSSSSNIPVSERYWTLVDKADKKFSKIRDLPYYEHNRYNIYNFFLWEFLPENRQKLVEAGLMRWEMGEIASRIAQLYHGQYLRTSEASYLSEACIFYEAILTREYFKEESFQDFNLPNKQLRSLARFLMVCLVLNWREMVHHLVSQLKMLVDECKRTFQLMKYRCALNKTAFNIVTFVFLLRLIQSFTGNIVIFEWEPSGSLYLSAGSKSGQNEALGSSRFNDS